MASAAKVSNIRLPLHEPQSARVTVLMTPSKKAQIEADAARLGVSSGEYIRLAVDNYDDAEDEALLIAIVEELDAAVPRMIATLERSTAQLEATHLYVDSVLRELGLRE